MDSSGEQSSVTLQRNPLLISTVVNCVFEYLPLKDLKQCRVVCHEWNSVSTQILNKKSKTKLDSIERIKHFLQFYKARDIKGFPFTTFHLKFSHDNWNTEEYEQLTDFFNTLRENIITLTFDGLFVRGELQLTPLIKIATNLVRLTVICSGNSIIELDQLVKVKYLSLSFCCVSLDSFENRIAPLSICLDLVTFKTNEKKLGDILINDYIDFSGCSDIKIASFGISMTFDMSRDVVSAKKVYFDGLRIINWEATPAKIDKRLLSFEEYTGMGLKQLNLNRLEFSLPALPKSLEKLSLDRNTYGSNNGVPIALPNLKCLIFTPLFDYTTAIMSPAAYDMGIITSMFRRCPKLVDIELRGLCSQEWRCNIDVDILPVTLKRIKLSDNKNINLVGDQVIHVDSLILNAGTVADAQKFMNKIKPKIVVVQLQCFQFGDPADEIVCFVQESRNLEKVVLKVPDYGVDEVLRSYKRALSTYVEDDDTESNYYAITNEVGKCLTEEEFKFYWF